MSLEGPVYVSGPMGGYPNKNFASFEAAVQALRARGHEVLSPHEVALPPEATWEDAMRADLVLLVRARSCVVLEGWECSPGARLEVYIAHWLGIHVRPLQLALKL